MTTLERINELEDRLRKLKMKLMIVCKHTNYKSIPAQYTVGRLGITSTYEPSKEVCTECGQNKIPECIITLTNNKELV